MLKGEGRVYVAMVILLPADVVCDGVLPHLSLRDLQALDTAYCNTKQRPYFRSFWKQFNYDCSHETVDDVEFYWLYNVEMKIVSVKVKWFSYREERHCMRAKIPTLKCLILDRYMDDDMLKRLAKGSPLLERLESYTPSMDDTATDTTCETAMSDGLELSDYDQCVEVIRNCSVVVGMHPDQAAEHIIRFCLANNKPFAIIPCCVYSSQFPKRRHAETGGPVKEFGHFIEYLMSLDIEKKIAAAQLDFDGKNILLYYLADRVPEMDPTMAEVHVCRGSADSAVWWSISRQARKTCRCRGTVCEEELT